MGGNYAEVPASRIYSKILIIILAVGVVAVSVRMLLGGYVVDDAYHIVMSYRQAIGDRLFMEMWEPHQTSGFLSVVLIRLFIALFGTTEYLVIYLRVCGLIIHGLVAFLLYKTLVRIISKEQAALIAVLSYALFPKLSALPEFSNMQYWFTAISLCLLLRAHMANYEKLLYVILSATFLSLSIVSYPPGIVLAFAYLLFFIPQKEKNTKRAMVCFFLTCFIEGIAYLLTVIWGKNLRTVVANVRNVMLGDKSHLSGINVAGEPTKVDYANGFLTILVLSLAVIILSLAVSYIIKKVIKKDALIEIAISFSVLITYTLTAYLCFVRQTGFDCIKLQYIVLPIEALIVLIRAESRKTDKTIGFLVLAIAVGALVIVGVSFVTNLKLVTNIPFMQIALLWSLVAICYTLKSKAIVYSLVFAVLISLGITGYTQKTSVIGKNIFQYNGMVYDGPAKYIICDSVIKKFYETGNREISGLATEEDSVFIFSDNLYAAATELYMASPAKIGQYSTICTPTYGEAHTTYWEEFPDRFPTLVVVENGRREAMEQTYAYKYLFEKHNYYLAMVGEHFTYYRLNK